MRGSGGTARLVLLPFEDHGYRAKKSIEHVLWEQINWFDKYVKNREVIEGWSGFWLRIYGEQKAEEEIPQMLVFDNMQDRPIKGTTDWTKYEILMKVPDKSVSLVYGSLLIGKGKLWIDNILFEEVTGDESNPVNSITEGPINTSFED